MSIYSSISGVNKEIKSHYGIVSGINKEIKEIYGTSDGINKKIHTGNIYTLSNLLVNGNQYNFPSGIVGTSIEFDINTNIPTGSSAQLYLYFNKTQTAFIQIMHERYRDPVDGPINETIIYPSFSTGFYLGFATISGKIKFVLNNNYLNIYFNGDNILNSALSSLTTFTLDSYVATTYNTGSATYKNLIVN